MFLIQEMLIYPLPPDMIVGKKSSSTTKTGLRGDGTCRYGEGRIKRARKWTGTNKERRRRNENR